MKTVRDLPWLFVGIAAWLLSLPLRLLRLFDVEEEPDLDFMLDDAEWERRTAFVPDIGAEFCPKCSYAWSVHDNSDPLTVRPFGCPTETTARLRWGR